MRLKKILALILTGLMLLAVAAPALAQQPPLKTTASSAMLMDASTGQILYAKDPHKSRPPASVTKIMTMVVAFDALAKGKVKLEDMVMTSENAWEMGGSELYLEPGEKMPLKEMMVAIAVGSANDACVAVAEHIAGSEEAYVSLMNKKAKELGMKNTHFVNTHGLPAKNHYTSAYDLAILTREALKYPLFNKFTSIYEYSWRSGKKKAVRHNTNKLLVWYDGCDGGKTGWTTEAQYCLASTAIRDNLRLIAVVMATPEPQSHFRESMKLYNWGFANYEGKVLARKARSVEKVLVSKGKADEVNVAPERDVTMPITKGEDKKFTQTVRLRAYVEAPVKKGEVLGEIVVSEKGQELVKVNLVAQEDVARGNFIRQVLKLLFRVFTTVKGSV